jgi:hypothetical protein
MAGGQQWMYTTPLVGDATWAPDIAHLRNFDGNVFPKRSRSNSSVVRT